MELLLDRYIYTDKSTVGKLTVDGLFECFILEDVDRGLTNKMSLTDIVKHKVFGATAIPKGRYEVVITYSNRFKRMLPLLVNVPGYDGIRIHPGNTAVDTLGCLLTGTTRSTDFVGQSRMAFDRLMPKLEHAKSISEQIFITIN